MISLPRHRGQLRVPGLLAALPGRQHRREIRATGIAGHHPALEGEQGPPYGTVVDVTPMPRSTSTSWWPDWTSTIMDGNTVMEVDSMGLPVSPDNPHGLAGGQQVHPDRPPADRVYIFDQRHPVVAWKVVNPNKTNASAPRWPYKLAPGACFVDEWILATTQATYGPR